MRPRFLADHDLNEQIIMGVLRQEPTIEFLHAREVGMSERPDVEILDYADREQLLVVSHDMNTMPAAASSRLAAGQSIPGLFMVQQRSHIGPVIDSLTVIWAASELEEWKDQITFLPLK